jgi:hypothetical protein
MHQFFVYKEYGAKYEIMIKDATSALENLPEWEIHQKGLEAFAFTMESSPSGGSRKSLTIGDLLVKVSYSCSFFLHFPQSDTLLLAYSANLQISSSVCRIIKMYSCFRLSEFSYGS